FPNGLNNIYIIVDGGWNVWSQWSSCSGKCGEEGFVNRSRICSNPVPLHYGIQCHGDSKSQRICRGKCPATSTKIQILEAKRFLEKLNKGFPQLEQDCIMDHCSYDQLGALMKKDIKTKYWSSLQCYKYKRACPVDGGWSSWSDWSSCQPQCGSGVRWRTRSCTKPKPENGGLPCRGPLYKEEHCFGLKCSKEDFLYGHFLSEWSPFGPCSVSCGKYGTMTKTRVCLKPGACSKQLGKKDNQEIIKPCYTGPCPGGGGWSSWNKFTPCSAVCGRGRKTRLRHCDSPVSTEFTNCVGYSVDTQPCSQRCGRTWKQNLEKVLSMSRKAKKMPGEITVSIGAKNTTKNDGRSISFGEQDHPAYGDPYSVILNPRQEITYEMWSVWTACSKSCGSGIRLRTRNCKVKEKPCYGEVIQRQYCNTIDCPISGGWGDWQAWTPCSVTCRTGIQKRYRRCDSPLPQNGGTCLGQAEKERKCKMKECKAESFSYGEWEKWSKCSKECGMGTKTRKRSCQVLSSDPATKQIMDKSNVSKTCSKTGSQMTHSCNPMPCPVNGKWANWGTWSTCNEACGLGQRYRDRACTDPAPVNGGSNCEGSGSDIAHCFTSPCQESSLVGVRFKGTGFLLYNPRHKASHFLSLYVLLTPKTKNGMILQRFRGCKSGICSHNVTLSLHNGVPWLVVKDGKHQLDLIGNKHVQDSIFIYVHGKDATMRVDDGKHVIAKFTPELNDLLNYDAKMIVGLDKNKSAEQGYKGDIESLRVNFRTLSLVKSPSWKGYGSPIKSAHINQFKLKPYSGYPVFTGHSFMKSPFPELSHLSLKLTFYAISLDGVLFFNYGLHRGSYTYMVINNGALRVCLQCANIKKPVCEDIDIIQSRVWYHITVFISGNAARIRLNNNTAVQLTSVGPSYRMESPVWFGVGEKLDKIILQTLTGQKSGLHGVIHDININGNAAEMKGKALLDDDGFLNSLGASIAERVDEVVERTSSIVTLKCDFTQYYSRDKHAAVEWFHGDRRVKYSSDRKSTERLPGVRKIGSLELRGPHHQGIYLCAVRHNGVLTVQHAFVVIRHNIKHKITMAEVEQEVFQVTMIVVPLMFLVCLLVAAKLAYKEENIKALKPLVAKIRLRIYRERTERNKEKDEETKENDDEDKVEKAKEEEDQDVDGVQLDEIQDKPDDEDEEGNIEQDMDVGVDYEIVQDEELVTPEGDKEGDELDNDDEFESIVRQVKVLSCEVSGLIADKKESPMALDFSARSIPHTVKSGNDFIVPQSSVNIQRTIPKFSSERIRMQQSSGRIRPERKESPVAVNFSSRSIPHTIKNDFIVPRSSIDMQRTIPKFSSEEIQLLQNKSQVINQTLPVTLSKISPEKRESLSAVQKRGSRSQQQTVPPTVPPISPLSPTKVASNQGSLSKTSDLPPPPSSVTQLGFQRKPSSYSKLNPPLPPSMPPDVGLQGKLSSHSKLPPSSTSMPIDVGLQGNMSSHSKLPPPPTSVPLDVGLQGKMSSHSKLPPPPTSVPPDVGLQGNMSSHSKLPPPPPQISSDGSTTSTKRSPGGVKDLAFIPRLPDSQTTFPEVLEYQEPPSVAMSESELDPLLSTNRDNQGMYATYVRPSLAEFVGTALFVFIGCMSSQTGDPVAIGLAHGLSIALLVVSFGNISGGHFNPVVTLGVTLSRALLPSVGVLYFVFQLLGGMLGAALARGVLPEETYKNINGGTQVLGPNVEAGWAVLTEGVLTFMLVLTVLLAAVDNKTKSSLAPLAIGFVVIVDIMAGGNVTGASMNPARSFGPAVVFSPFISDGKPEVWTYHYVYWVGPAGGSIVSALVYSRSEEEVENVKSLRRTTTDDDDGRRTTDDGRHAMTIAHFEPMAQGTMHEYLIPTNCHDNLKSGYRKEAENV
ncbi:hypothetical protein FSP39_021648, partial [Pinctada imbricata]